MPPLVASWPWCLLLWCSWSSLGLALGRRVLGLTDGVAACTLALPLGLVGHLLVANLLGHWIYLPFLLLFLAPAALLASLVALRTATPLVWSLGRGARVGLATAWLALALGVLVANAREEFGDDGGHASMAQLLSHGQFPLRFQCNPELRSAYPYGGDLLAAQARVVAALPVWTALDLAKAAAVAAVAGLAFLCGYRPRRSAAAGLLAVFLLATAGPCTWIYLPLGQSGLAFWAEQHPGLQPMIVAMHDLTLTPWKYALMNPGFITSQFPHAQRTLAWTFAPFVVLLTLALAEVVGSPRRHAIALGVVVASAGLLQPAALLVLVPALLAGLALAALRRTPPARTLWLGVAVGLLLLLAQGGPITDSLLDRWRGQANPTTGFSFEPLIWPSCRARALDLRCRLLSLSNLGLAPLVLLPWLLWRHRRDQGPRLALLLGCLGAYAVPWFFRYTYFDWNIQRSQTFATWIVAALAAAALHETWQRGRVVARSLVVAVTVGLCWTGTLQLALAAEGSAFRDRTTPAQWRLSPLDDALVSAQGRLSLASRIFDPAGCQSGTSSRPAIVLGRYSASSVERGDYARVSAAEEQLRVEPTAASLRAAGYTHAYVDGAWLTGLVPKARNAFLADPGLEALAQAENGSDLRALVRVCALGEHCRRSGPVLAGLFHAPPALDGPAN